MYVENKINERVKYLSNSPRNNDGSVLGVRQDALGGIVEAEEGSAVDDDTLDGDSEATVQTDEAISLEDFD